MQRHVVTSIIIIFIATSALYAQQFDVMPVELDRPFVSAVGPTDLRSGPGTEYPVDRTVDNRTNLKITGWVLGEPIDGDPLWYQIEWGAFNVTVLYVHRSNTDDQTHEIVQAGHVPGRDGDFVAPTLTPTSTPEFSYELFPQRLYVDATDGALLFSCPFTTCNIDRELRRGQSLTIVGYATGEAVGGHDLWYEVEWGTFSPTTHYIHRLSTNDFEEDVVLKAFIAGRDGEFVPPSATPTATNTFTPTPEFVVNRISESTDLTIESLANAKLRACPFLSCSIGREVAGGTNLSISGYVIGEAVRGEPVWYQVEWGTFSTTVYYVHRFDTHEGNSAMVAMGVVPSAIPSVTLTPSDTPTETPTLTQTNTPSATPSATNTSTATLTQPPSLTPTASDTPTLIPGAVSAPVYDLRQTMFAASAANVRTCPALTPQCNAGRSLTYGQAVTRVGVISGEAWNGETDWFIVEIDDIEGFVHSDLLATTRPATAVPPPAASSSGSSVSIPDPAPQQPVNPPTAQSNGWNGPAEGAATFSCPGNCTEAREMGLTAEQAASCGRYLDRDGDGLACYGT